MKSTIEFGISASTEFHKLWDLPALPLTERFGNLAAMDTSCADQLIGSRN